MAFNNVPANGWPQIKDLEKLDAIAQAIENMPTFTSSDRDWMDEWEQKLPELPADPETDGVKVLTATTVSGETVKSWEEPESSNTDYSTNEVNTGKKWIDGKDVYTVIIHETEDTEQTSKVYSLSSLNIDKVFLGMNAMILGTVANSKYVSGNEYVDASYNRAISVDTSELSVKSTGWKFKEVWAELFYTKATT